MANSETGLPDQIITTAKNLFIQKGYFGLSMREISDALGVSKAALYYYFKDKEQLFLAILRLYLNDMDVLLVDILQRPLSCKEQIRLFIEHILTQPAEQRATIRLFMQEISHLSPESRHEFDTLYNEKFIGKLKSIIQAGMRTGEFREMSSDLAVWALLGIMFPYFYPMRAGDAVLPIETINEVTSIYLRGICN